jgi:hypothetical protein
LAGDAETVADTGKFGGGVFTDTVGGSYKRIKDWQNEVAVQRAWHAATRLIDCG